MNETTPAEKVAATPVTVERIARLLTEADSDPWHDYYWWVRTRAVGNVVEIDIEPRASDGTRLDEVHFRAVVVEGEQTPIVMDRATFEQRVNDRFDNAIRKLGGESLAFMPATIAALREQILNVDVDLAEAAQAQTGGASDA